MAAIVMPAHIAVAIAHAVAGRPAHITVFTIAPTVRVVLFQIAEIAPSLIHVLLHVSGPSMTPSPGYADTAEELRPNGAAIRKADIKTTVFVGNIEITSCSRLNARQAEPLPDTPSFMQTACQLINSLSQDTEPSPYLSLIIGCYKINKNGFLPKILVRQPQKTSFCRRDKNPVMDGCGLLDTF